MEDHRKHKVNLTMIIQEYKGMNRVDQMTIITDRIKIDQTEVEIGKVDKMTMKKETEILQITVKPIKLKQQILNIQDNQFPTYKAINQIFYHRIQL